MHDVYMGTALLYARKSKANRAQVGAVLVTATGIIIPGINGTPADDSNECEDPETGSTKPTVIHAETNCVLKAAKEGVSIIGATVYVTLSPCLSCSAMLIQAGVKNIYYKDEYRDLSSVEYLRRNGVNVEKYDQSIYL